MADYFVDEEEMLQSIIREILYDLDQLTDFQREQVFIQIRENWCLHCGTDQRERDIPCQCTNDV